MEILSNNSKLPDLMREFWELYLYAAFIEVGYAFDRAYSAPDFLCTGVPGKFFVEATTVNASPAGPVIEELTREEYFQNYSRLSFGSARFSKLQKKYWELPHVGIIPLVFAIQDFTSHIRRRGAHTR
jgi:hypothetical protein